MNQRELLATLTIKHARRVVVRDGLRTLTPAAVQEVARLTGANADEVREAIRRAILEVGK